MDLDRVLFWGVILVGLGLMQQCHYSHQAEMRCMDRDRTYINGACQETLP